MSRHTPITFLFMLIHIFCLCADAAPPSTHKRILLNAEPFGFGPSAAIAEIFPHLRDKISSLGYAGYGHTLDLQQKLAYDAIYDFGDAANSRKKEKFQQLAVDYDIFITALDFEAAKWAKEMGLKVIIYDPLTWFWKDIPPEIKQMDLYIAQNFFGVSERIKANPDDFPETVIVPALVSPNQKATSYEPSKELLVNLGGLNNPFLEEKDLILFSTLVFETIKNACSTEFDKTTYLANQTIAKAMATLCTVETLTPQETQSRLSSSNLAIMTSGLANLYEASLMNKKVIWLPPVNDSQGQQIMLLKQHGMVDYHLDWLDIFVEDEPIDYFDAQEKVMRQIAIYLKRLSQEPASRIRFKEFLLRVYADSLKDKSLTLPSLASTFGTDGAIKAAESILLWIEKQQGVESVPSP